MMANEDRSKIDQHLAWCVCRIRANAVPDAPWDQRGVAAAMAEVQHREPHEVFAAACRLAADPKVRTPKVLAFEGEHWQQPKPVETDRSITAYRGPRCRACGRDRAGHDAAEAKTPPEARHEWTETDPPRATPDRVAAIRAKQAQMQERQL